MEYPFKDLLPLDEVLAREGYYKDWTHLDPEVFYSLTQISNFIKTKGYGADVRLLISQLAEHFGLSVVEVTDIANKLIARQDAVEDFNTQVIQEMTDKDVISAPELIAARGGKPTLQARLDDTTAQLAQTTGNVEHYYPQLDITPKLLYKINDVYFIVTRKPSGNGFVRFRLEKGIVDTSSASVGGSSELTRVTEVFNVTEAFMLKFENSSKSTYGWGVDTTVLYNGVAVSLKAISEPAPDAWIEYDVEVPTGATYIQALIYGSGGSSQNVTISVDGEAVMTSVSFMKNPAAFFKLNIPVTSGHHKIRLTTTTASYMSVAGLNLVDLNDYKKGQSVDKYYVIHQGVTNQYITNAGAMDYAMVDGDTGLYVGSYHGGETLLNLGVVIDGVTTTLDNGGFAVGKTIEIEQTTRIVDKLTSYTRSIFRGDGSFEMEIVFEGDINLKKLWTNMTTAHTTFTEVIYPKRLDVSSNGDYYLTKYSNYIIQRNPVNNQKITTIINNNTLPSTNDATAYIATSIYYKKLYRANIDSLVSIRFTDGQFRTIHIFD